LILNVTDGGLKRHTGSLSSEAQVGASASSKVGFHGTIPTAQRANADQSAATDLDSVIALANASVRQSPSAAASGRDRLIQGLAVH
jgi:hypothetical protein